MKIIVYTCITGQKDDLRQDQCTKGAEFIAFMDKPVPSRTWEIRPACNLFVDPRRNARMHKILAHQFFPDAQYSLWMDGPCALKVPVESLIERYLVSTGADLAIFRHPERDCLYDEAEVCAEWGLDDPTTLLGQAEAYRSNDYPEHNGLCETGILLRKHSPRMDAFENAWWSELCRHSKRDQVSFEYALNRSYLHSFTSGLRVSFFTGTIKVKNGRLGNSYFDYAEHAR